MNKPLYKQLATCANVLNNPHNNNVTDRWREYLYNLEKLLPYGSGFDSGCELELEKSTPDKLVIKTSYHHLDDNGFYSGWTDHKVIVTPSLRFGFELRVTGKNKNQIKDYIVEEFYHVLSQDCGSVSW